MKEPNNFDETVPGRPTAAELRAMALRQQQQIDSQHQLLAAKEQRLRFLKAQEARGAAAAAEGERLRRLRERVEAQESKLRRLRALRGQVDLQKTYNVTLSNDLDSIRALFSEKEKELSLAVAKVEALTRQLEDLRRDRRGPLNLIPGNGSNGAGANQQIATSPAARELDKLRRELMYRNQISLQQDARLHLQREALQQRQAELRSVDQRILELQTRLQRKKASNLLLQAQQQQQQQQPATINVPANTNNNNTNLPVQTPTVQLQNIGAPNRPSSNVYPTQRVIPRGNVAAVEPYIHTPQKQSITTGTTTTSTNAVTGAVNSNGNSGSNNNIIAPSSKLIQDLTKMKLNQMLPSQQLVVNSSSISNNINSAVSANHHISYPESDENKLARQKYQQQQQQQQQQIGKGGQPPAGILTMKDVDSSEFIGDFTAKKSDPKYQTLPYNTKFGVNFVKTMNTAPAAIAVSVPTSKSNECDSEKAAELSSNTVAPLSSDNTTSTGGKANQFHQTTVHSIPLSTINKSVAVPVAVTTANKTESSAEEIKPAIKPKALHHQIPSGNLVVPPRKPISSVAPTSITMAPKIVAHSPKVHMVAPSVNVAPIVSSIIDADKSRPALPPKPHKHPASMATHVTTDGDATPPPLPAPIITTTASSTISTLPTVVSVINKAPISEPQPTVTYNSNNLLSYLPLNTDNLPIKAKPLTIKKQPLSEQPKLRSLTSGIKPIQYTSRRIEMPPAFLFPEVETAELKDKSGNNSPNSSGSIDETDKSAASSTNGDIVEIIKSPPPHEEVIRRGRHSSLLSDNGKAKLARRVSFDPLALLLDASLEGELELVRKTAMQVTNPSAANDEGITALHNAICAGHLEIVKFLVEFGCDVNAQDSDGWTPLHCAASCNNLPMVKFLVESGACLFAATLSDHETPAEKCEEDEEGFDGCSEYLYSIQEKLGILNTGEVYAVFSYDAQQQDELNFQLNDRLTILRKGDDAEREWWWARNGNNKEGYVPRNLLGLYPRVQPQYQSQLE